MGLGVTVAPEASPENRYDLLEGLEAQPVLANGRPQMVRAYRSAVIITLATVVLSTYSPRRGSVPITPSVNASAPAPLAKSGTRLLV